MRPLLGGSRSFLSLELNLEPNGDGACWSAARRPSLALQGGNTTTCGARQLNSSFTPPAVGGGAERPGDRRFRPAFRMYVAPVLYKFPSQVCPNPSMAGRRCLGSRPTADVFTRGVRRHSHIQNARSKHASGAKRRADNVPTTEQGKQDTGYANYACQKQKPDATAPSRGTLPLGGTVRAPAARCRWEPLMA